MRTAEEMYQYCVDNGFGTGWNRKWGVKHFSLIEQALNADEQIIMCFIGLHNYDSSNHDSNFAYAITNKRIIMAQQKVIGQNFQTVSLENVNDVSMSTSLLMGVITVDTIKEKFNVGVDKITAKKINDMIHDILLTTKKNETAPIPTANNISVADEILKFKKLFDMGAITQEEFEKKKAELLG